MAQRKEKMIEQLGKMSDVVVRPVNKKGPTVEILAQELGVPADRTSQWLDALYASFSGSNQEQRAIEYLSFKLEIRKIR